MNDAAFNLCLENPSLINCKGELVKLARAKLDSDGYNYAKNKSRSAVFGTAKEESSTGGEKRKKLSEDIRQKIYVRRRFPNSMKILRLWTNL